jgi:predicted permease
VYLIFKYALRQLAKSPGFTCVSVVMLALGIGMSTSTFSITNSVVLSTMPFPAQDQLVQLFGSSTHSQMMPHSPGDFLDIRSAVTSFSNVVGIVPRNANVAVPGQPPEVQFGISVTSNFLPTLGVQPILGRGFAADEDQPGKGAVVILTNTYWRRQFGADPKVIGSTLRVGIDNLTVIGVLPPEFDRTLIWFGCSYLQPFTVWPPFATQRKDRWVSMIGRLKPGVTLSAAQAELSTIAARLDHDFPAEHGLDGLRVTGLAASYIDANTRKLYWLVVGLSGAVLIIACANLASVQLARAFGRSHEFAVRAALGAGRVDLMGPLVVESLLLTAGGGVLGILFASWANHLVSRYFTGNFEIAIDRRVALYAALASLVTALTFGFTPAWLATRVSTGDALKESSRGSTSSRAQRRLKFGLIVGQLALALVLVSAALSFGVAVRSFFKHDLGWRPEGLFTGIINVPYERYKEDPKKIVLVRALLEKLAQVPGVDRASLSESVPIYGYPGMKKIIVEGTAPVPRGQEPDAFFSAVDGGFFGTMGIPLKEGRLLPQPFKDNDPPFILVNETMARSYWPGKSALGRRVKLADQDKWLEVIGVVGDITLPSGFDAPATRLQIYGGLQEQPGIWYNFVLKSALPADALVKPVRKAIGEIDPDLMIAQIGGVPEIFENILAGNNLMIITLGAFAFIGLLIAIIGLYGVISQLTMQRTREIGIRMALGADYFAVVRLILAQGGLLIACGVVAGLAGAYGVGVIYRQTMPELRLPGLGLQIGISALLCVSGLVACYVPARRAGRVNPVAALRAE